MRLSPYISPYFAGAEPKYFQPLLLVNLGECPVNPAYTLRERAKRGMLGVLAHRARTQSMFLLFNIKQT